MRVAVVIAMAVLAGYVIVRLLFNIGLLLVNFCRCHIYEPGAAFVLTAGLTSNGQPDRIGEAYLRLALDLHKQHIWEIWVLGGGPEPGKWVSMWQAYRDWLLRERVNQFVIITPDKFNQPIVWTTQQEVEIAVQAIHDIGLYPFVIANHMQLRRVKLMFLWYGIRVQGESIPWEVVREEWQAKVAFYVIHEWVNLVYALWDPTGHGWIARLTKTIRINRGAVT